MLYKQTQTNMEQIKKIIQRWHRFTWVKIFLYHNCALNPNSWMECRRLKPGVKCWTHLQREVRGVQSCIISLMVYFLFCLKKRWRIFLNAPVFGVILNHGFYVLVNISIRLQTQQAIERRIYMMQAIFFFKFWSSKVLVSMQGMAPLQVCDIYEV